MPVDPNVEGIYPQVAYAIGKQCGNAVVRNSLRRRMRETARDMSDTLPRGTYLLRVSPAAVQSDRVAFTTNVRKALQRAAEPRGETL